MNCDEVAARDRLTVCEQELLQVFHEQLKFLVLTAGRWLNFITVGIAQITLQCIPIYK